MLRKLNLDLHLLSAKQLPLLSI